ncbi:MAG TPA: hypothetical protein VLT59_04165 [Steroidobacteraceae bacterium]|nr:hypothetical protein [Steroidobacteraceae bacterium]
MTVNWQSGTAAARPAPAHETAWQAGRLDGRRGPPRVLFGRMYEDVELERSAFARGGRVLCIASAGCTAIDLAADYAVTAVDINATQIDYVRARLDGAPASRGSAEAMMQIGRRAIALAGWTRTRLHDFIELDDPAAQLDFWRKHLDTHRFRWALDLLLSQPVLKTGYAPEFVSFAPPGLGRRMRGRLERCISRHPNRTNPYLRGLLVGELPAGGPPPHAARIPLHVADAAGFLESQPPDSFDGFTLSNILDGATAAYRERLFKAVSRTASPGAVIVLRSFRESPRPSPYDRSDADRSILWGRVEVVPVSELDSFDPLFDD